MHVEYLHYCLLILSYIDFNKSYGYDFYSMICLFQKFTMSL